MTVPSGVHVWARDILRGVFPNATPTEIQGAQTVGLHEGTYGHATKPASWIGSNNWGAIQCCKPLADGTCPEGSFLAVDYDAKSDKKYSICFQAYPTPEAGAADLVRHLTKLRPHTGAALKTGDADQIAAAMYVEHYYGGFGKTDAERVKGYSDALAKAARTIAAQTGELLVTQKGGAAIVPDGGGSSGFGGKVLVVAVGVGLVALSRRR